MRLQIDTKDAVPSIRISFTDQRLTTHGRLIVWSHFLRQKKFRQQLREVLPHDPTSSNAYAPTDVALGYVGGIPSGADKLSRVAWLQGDAAVAKVLGVAAITSQSTLRRIHPEGWSGFGRLACPRGLRSAHAACRLHTGSGQPDFLQKAVEPSQKAAPLCRYGFFGRVIAAEKFSAGKGSARTR